MRDVAMAGEPAQLTATSAASAVRKGPLISCSPRGRTSCSPRGRTGLAMPIACHTGGLAIPLKYNGYFQGPVRLAGAGASIPCRFRQFLPAAFLPRVNHRRTPSYYARIRTEPNGPRHIARRGAALVQWHLLA